MHIPDHFEFYNRTKICSGDAALEGIPFELESMNAARPLVITDRLSANTGIVKAFKKSFDNSGVTIGALFDEIPDKATGSIVSDLTRLFAERGCDSIIAIGGEPVSSAAKGLNVLLSNRAEGFLKIKNLDKGGPFKPFIYIPTFGATGTETANELLIDDLLFKSDLLSPDIVAIDRRMLKNSRRSNIPASAMFALTQSIEACSLPKANPVNDSFAYASIALVYENLADALRCCFNGREKVALMNGIALSGIVYSNAGEGITRALAFETERMTGYPASVCAGIILPYTLDYMLHSDRTSIRGELLLQLAGIDNYCSVPENERSAKSVELIYLLLDNLEGMIPTSLRDLGVRTEVLKKIAKSAESRTAGRYKKGAAMKILEHAFDGKPFNRGI